MAPATRAMRARVATSADKIPQDALFDALLRLPAAKDLCGLRVVSRSWRAVISDPVFIAAHGDCHRQTLLVVKFWGDEKHIYVVNLSGNVLKRLVAGSSADITAPTHRLLRTCLEVTCLANHRNRCRVINPSTGAVHVLPEDPAPEHADRVDVSNNPYTNFALGWVSSTGQHKVLRMFNKASLDRGQHQFFEVFTINGGADNAVWRAQENPGLLVEDCSGTVVDEVVYFLTSSMYDDVTNGIRADYIISFDLEREEWRRDLRGPISSNVHHNVARSYSRLQLALAGLKGSLVLADHRRHPCTMDLWFLVDFGNGLWEKQYHIQTRSIVSIPTDEYLPKPFLVLDDGRLVVFVAPTGQLFICDPGTSTFEQVNVRRLNSVGVYTGNLLSLEEAGRV